MKHLKKILAIFLIVLTIISMCSAAMPVFAENRLFAENNEIDEFDIPEDDYVEPEIISEITEKEKGLMCNCFCPGCGEKLQARLGEIKQKH